MENAFDDSAGLGTPGSLQFADSCRNADSRSWGYRLGKRVFDIAFAGCACAIGLIPGAIMAIVIAIDTKGAPIYMQERAGRLGRPIRILKFRTMVVDADNVGKYLSEGQLEEWRRERKVTNDPRITKLGKVLRRISLDELPQFFNVLVGQLSVIGPRAITYDELDNYAPEEQVELLSVPQGVTGAWQSGPRNLAIFENGLRQQVELAYVRSASFKVDARVFVKTFGVMFGKEKTGR